MTPIKLHAAFDPMSQSILLKFELNGYWLDTALSRKDWWYQGEIDTLALFRFVRENMDLRTINQFKELKEIKE